MTNIEIIHASPINLEPIVPLFDQYRPKSLYKQLGFQLDQAFLTYQFEIATHHEQNSPIHR